jgi:hypothetical protein
MILYLCARNVTGLRLLSARTVMETLVADEVQRQLQRLVFVKSRVFHKFWKLT